MPGYEYLDHPADVQIHAWGDNLKDAFENAAVALTAYITDLDSIEIKTKEDLAVEADDKESLLFRFLDEILFLFNAEPNFLAKRVRILDFCETTFRIRAECYGEHFDLNKHPQGTEIKAITYSAMRVLDNEVYFIVDI